MEKIFIGDISGAEMGTAIKNALSTRPDTKRLFARVTGDSLIALGSGGTHYITGRNGITEIIVGKPRWFWTTLKTAFNWERMLIDAYRNTIIRSSDIKIGGHPDWNVLENRLKELLDGISVKVFVHKTEREESRDQLHQNVGRMIGQSGRLISETWPATENK
jgi:hypothetical protein